MTYHNECLCTCTDAQEALRSAWMTQTASRPRDRYNLPKPLWREMLKALFGPAVRLHRYRNLRSSMFYDAMCDLDGCDGEQRAHDD